MEINADFSKRVAVRAARLPWIPSPMKGVDRRMLDRVGDEVARATSIVRYASHSHFSAHTHGGGEEFLVLEGVFQDEHGDFPAGSYVRNPPTSSHTPGSASGCVIFVKLWQFDPEDRTQVRLDTAATPFTPLPARPGVEVIPLFRDDREEVRLERWSANGTIALNASELRPLVISSRLAIIRSSVDFPHPDGPTRTRNSPSRASMSTLRMTFTEPKFFSTFSILTPAM